MENFTVRLATEADVPTIMELIRGIARYEKLEHEVVATEELLRKNLFINRYAEVVLGELEGKAIGFVLFFHNFSTFVGKPGIYIEDIYVDEAYRGCGYGRKLFNFVAKEAQTRDCGRMEWVVLDWNEDAIRFYNNSGAKPQKQWIIYRHTAETLDQLLKNS